MTQSPEFRAETGAADKYLESGIDVLKLLLRKRKEIEKRHVKECKWNTSTFRNSCNKIFQEIK